jgi:[ribosomal protein S5]-alanine N-acetyltransferase
VTPPMETLLTERLMLRALATDDAPSVVRICRPLEVAKNTLSIVHPYTVADADSFLERITESMAKGDTYCWAIALKSSAGDTGEHIGTMGLHCNHEHRHAEVGYTIAIDHWGKGYATEALRAVIGFGFLRVGLARIHAGYYTRNPASGRVLEKCGFVQEGLRPRMYERFGEWVDLALMRIFREDWEASRVRLDSVHPSR